MPHYRITALPHYRITALTTPVFPSNKKNTSSLEWAKGVWSIVLALLVMFATPVKTYAMSSWFEGLIQANPGGFRVLMTNNLFERQFYSIAGASVGFNAWIWDPIEEKLVYRLEKGDRAEVDLYDVASGVLIGFGFAEVISDDGLCWSDGFQTYCGYFGAMNFGFGLQCMPEHQQIRIKGFFNNVYVGEGVLSLTPFHPEISELFMPGPLEPRRTKTAEGQHGDMRVVVWDDLDCGFNIVNAKVTVTSTIGESGTNGQTYFSKGDRGTGRFISLGYNSVLNPGGPHEMDTVIEGQTNVFGRFVTRYQAQNHGAKEDITFSVKRPATEKWPEIAGKDVIAEQVITIPGLEKITVNNAPVGFRDGNGCPHDPKPHWLAPWTRLRVMALAADYVVMTNRMLSLNDASLPYGGVIANRNREGRDKSCHVSHRQGIDVDVNRVDNDGVNMTLTTIEEKGKKLTLLEYMDERVVRIGGSIHHSYKTEEMIVEGEKQKVSVLTSIHWRLPK